MKKNIPYQICINCVMDTTDSGITFDKNGLCDYCLNFQKNIRNFFFHGKNKAKIISDYFKKIKKTGENKKYDCLIGISGGVDSCY